MEVDLRLTLFPTDEGGRTRPLLDGSSATWNLHVGADSLELNSGPVIIAAGQLDPGQTGDVTIRPLYPGVWSHVEAGQQLDLHTGVLRKGVGLVVAVRR